MMDVWGKLWDVATGEAGIPAKIEVDPDDVGAVVLVWSDGSRAALYWHEGDWRFAEAASGAPGDVAARGAL